MADTYNFRTEQVIIDRANDYIYTPLFSKTGDIGGRTLRVQVVDDGVVKDQSGLTLILDWRHIQAGNSGMDTFVAERPEFGQFMVEYPEEMLLEGVVECSVRIIEGEGVHQRITNTRNFKLTVERSAHNPDGLVVNSTFSTLQQILSLWHNLPEEFAAAVAGFNHFKGSYPNIEDLTRAWNAPIPGTEGLAKEGDYAYIGTEGAEEKQCIWDTSDHKWIQSGVAPYSPQEIKSMYESNANTNAFTDPNKTKLAGISSGAEVNVQSDWAQSDVASDDYIRNKPDVLGANGQPVAGLVQPYTGGSVPNGWLECNGAAVSRTTYAALFAVIGTTFGAGDGSSTFNLPNLRDKFLAGSGSSYSMGATGGANTVTLTTAQLPTHTHNTPAGNNGFWTRTTDNPHQNHIQLTSSGGNDTKITIEAQTSGTGSGNAHENRPPFVAVKFIISTGLQGVGGINFLAGNNVNFVPLTNGNVRIDASLPSIIQIVTELPAVGVEGVLYLVSEGETSSVQSEYSWSDATQSYTKTGQFGFELTDYRTKADQDTIDSTKATKVELEQAVAEMALEADLVDAVTELTGDIEDLEETKADIDYVDEKIAGTEKLLTAGENITIDRLDPENPVISSTGGGGGGGLTSDSFTDTDDGWEAKNDSGETVFTHTDVGSGHQWNAVDLDDLDTIETTGAWIVNEDGGEAVGTLYCENVDGGMTQKLYMPNAAANLLFSYRTRLEGESWGDWQDQTKDGYSFEDTDSGWKAKINGQDLFEYTDFGKIVDYDDLDTVLTPDFYFVTQNGENAGFLFVILDGNTSQRLYRTTVSANSDVLYEERYNEGQAWSDWQQVSLSASQQFQTVGEADVDTTLNTGLYGIVQQHSGKIDSFLYVNNDGFNCLQVIQTGFQAGNLLNMYRIKPDGEAWGEWQQNTNHTYDYSDTTDGWKVTMDGGDMYTHTDNGISEATADSKYVSKSLISEDGENSYNIAFQTSNNDIGGISATKDSITFLNSDGEETVDISSDKVKYADIVNDTTTGGETVPLSAQQGLVLQNAISGMSSPNQDRGVVYNAFTGDDDVYTVTSVTIANGGSSYIEKDALFITGAAGDVDCIVIADAVDSSTGRITSLSISKGGDFDNDISGTRIIEGGSGFGCTVEFTCELHTSTLIYDVVNPQPNDRVIVLHDELHGGIAYLYGYMDYNGDGTYNWVPITAYTGDQVPQRDFSTDQIKTGEVENKAITSGKLSDAVNTLINNKVTDILNDQDTYSVIDNSLAGTQIILADSGQQNYYSYNHFNKNYTTISQGNNLAYPTYNNRLLNRLQIANGEITAFSYNNDTLQYEPYIANADAGLVTKAYLDNQGYSKVGYVQNIIIATAGQTLFNCPFSLGSEVIEVRLLINGLEQYSGDDYSHSVSSSNVSVTVATGVSAGDKVAIKLLINKKQFVPPTQWFAHLELSDSREIYLIDQTDYNAILANTNDGDTIQTVPSTGETMTKQLVTGVTLNDAIGDNLGDNCLESYYYLQSFSFGDWAGETIGNNFMYDCASFNQPLIIPSTVLVIGECFMYHCASFNQDITIPAELVGGYFMAFLRDMTNTVTIKSSTTFAPSDNYTLVAQLDTSPAYTQGITIKGNTQQAVNDFLTKFPNDSTGYYRNLINGGVV
jgi:microcystin-dependent protein